MSDRNKALMRRAVEDVWNGKEPAAVEDLVATDFVIHTPSTSEDVRGRDGVKQFFAALHEAFPDIRFKIEDQIAEGDRVVTRWVAHGTHRGHFQGIPATGREVRLSGIDIDCIAGEKVVECWTQLDELGLMQQLGVLPEPQTVG